MSTPAQAHDVFDATRDVVNRLKPFAEEERSRILRWAVEMLGITGIGLVAAASDQDSVPGNEEPETSPRTGLAQDVRSFVITKRPKSDIQFAAVVAYFNLFLASPAVADIGAQELIDAYRQAGRRRPKDVALTLGNAQRAGL